MNSYEITKEYEALRALTVEEFDEETGEFIDNSSELNELLQEIDLKRDDKLKGLEYIKREYKAMVEAVANEKKRLDERKKAFERKIEKLEGFQKLLLKGEKVETDLFTFSFRKSTSLDISGVDIKSIDKKYTITEEVTTLINADIKKALIANEVIKGASLIVKNNLQVK